jgi:branched-chain amino acid transport system permease protein
VQVYYVIAFWLLVTAVLARAFMRTPVGRMCNAVRDNPERAEFIGYNPQRVRFIACSVAAMFAGLAGGLHAINYEIVTSEAVSATRSGEVLLMVYIGGVHHFIGAILGAVAITWLQVSLSDYTAAWLLYLGIFFMAIILYAPGGLASLIVRHAVIVRSRALGAVLRAYAFALPAATMMIVGAATLLEIAYRLSTQPEAGTRMKLFWIPMNAGTPWPWIGAAVVAIVGFLLLRLAIPRVRAAWDLALDETRVAVAHG